MRKFARQVMIGLGILIAIPILMLVYISLDNIVSAKLAENRARHAREARATKDRIVKSSDASGRANAQTENRAKENSAVIVSDGVLAADNGATAIIYVRTQDNYIVSVVLCSDDMEGRPKSLSHYASLKAGDTVWVRYKMPGYYARYGEIIAPPETKKGSGSVHPRAS